MRAAASEVRVEAPSSGALGTATFWFRAIVIVGVLVNLGFAIPALFMPALFNTLLGLPTQAFYPWLENAGMLLLALCLFYLPAGLFPARWPLYTWLLVISRAIAVVFWISLVRGGEYGSVFVPFLVTDAVMGSALLVGAEFALPESARLTPANLVALLKHLWGLFLKWLALPRHRLILGVLVAFMGLFGFEGWYWFARMVPMPAFESDLDHFKYAPIGLGETSRIPLYVFEVLPELCGVKGGYASFGFVYEPGKDLPIGLAQRHVGFPTVEPNCALCHTGTYRVSTADNPVPVPTAPANTLDLEGFQRFLYDCVGGDRFEGGAMLSAIQKRHELGPTETLFYRYVLYHVTRMALNQQAHEYAWQKLRPPQGPGRTDTFNPTKISIFGFPDDGTIGTVDYPQIWNQRKREGLWLHWDGNNNKIKERNYAAAMAVGATPESVIPENFKRVTNWLLDHPPPSYPFAIDKAKAARGEVLWKRECADCHAFGKSKTGQVTTDIEALGTDPHRLASFTIGLVDKFHTFEKPPFDFEAYRKTQSYSNTPTDGIWARAPYLHNGSVPTLWDLLQPVEKRPTKFYRGYQVYDQEHVGFLSQGPEAAKAGFLHDVRVAGNSNAGHLFGTDLEATEKLDLIEFMKTL